MYRYVSIYSYIFIYFYICIRIYIYIYIYVYNDNEGYQKIQAMEALAREKARKLRLAELKRMRIFLCLFTYISKCICIKNMYLCKNMYLFIFTHIHFEKKTRKNQAMEALAREKARKLRLAELKRLGQEADLTRAVKSSGVTMEVCRPHQSYLIDGVYKVVLQKVNSRTNSSTYSLYQY